MHQPGETPGNGDGGLPTKAWDGTTAPAEPPPLEAIGLGRRFGTRWVLWGLDFSAPAGQCVAIIGANGSGKTTLLRCLAGLLRPHAGQVRWFGHLAGKVELRGRMGFVGHESGLYAQLSVLENLRFAARMYGVSDPAGRAEQLAAEAGLAAYAHCRVAQLSQGMRQRAALARALVHSPRVVLWDEPFVGLDTQATDWLAGQLEALRRRGCTLCFSTHELHRAWQLADRVLALSAGRLQPASPPHAPPHQEGAGVPQATSPPQGMVKRLSAAECRVAGRAA